MVDNRPVIFVRGSFVIKFWENAAEELGIRLIHPTTDKGIDFEIEEVNSYDNVLAYIHFAAWGDAPIHLHIKRIKHKTVFCSLEDPNHFKTFFPYAEGSDIILTSAEELVFSYSQMYPTAHVRTFLWACDPVLHYQREDDPEFKDREFDIVFVGNRYINELDRCLGEQVVLLPALRFAKKHGLKFGVFGYGDDSVHSWKGLPEVWNAGVWQEHTSAFESGNIYRRSIVVLALNEQTKSLSMTSMRTFEAAACGNIVLSHYSLATLNLFQDLILMADDKEGTELILKDIFLTNEPVDGYTLNPMYIVQAMKARDFVYERHTYVNRLQFLLEVLYDCS